jgi:DAK2 domain fusion protein YloV
MDAHLTADHLKSVVSRYHERLGTYRDALNRLNVYPVPDGDTGTNMHLTVGTVVAEMAAAHDMREVSRALAHGSLMGARGNSGVILAQILRGLAETFEEVDRVGVPEVVGALGRASVAAYRAVLHPVEGTILTVLRAAAEAAVETGTAAGSDLAALLEGVFRHAEQALESTPSLLPVLERAGVVDAGGAGLLLLLAAFLEEVTGSEVTLPERIFTAIPVVDVTLEAIADLRYEVVLLLDAPDERLEAFRMAWGELGGSIVIVGGGGHYKCHIHTDHPAEAIESALRIDDESVGTFRDLMITDLSGQAADLGFHHLAGASVVPVAAGRGLAAIFRELGADDVVDGGQGTNPSTGDLLAAVERCPSATVIILPNNKNVIPAAHQVETLTDKRVVVVPTVSIPEGIAAMMEYLPARGADEMVAAMETASKGIRSGEITRAVRDARLEIGEVAEGDWLAVTDGSIVHSGDDLASVLAVLLEDLIEEDTELVTLFLGEGASGSATDAVCERIASARPEIVVELRDGGQPLYPYLVSVE